MTSACGSHTRTVSVSAMTSWTKGKPMRVARDSPALPVTAPRTTAPG